ncbi:MAG: hypothetical protein ACRDH9_02905 [Actinomycetota bacterium]
MMRPSHLAAQGADLVGRGVREVADSLAAGVELLGLAAYWLWLHLVLGALLITRLALLLLRAGLGISPRGRRP